MKVWELEEGKEYKVVGEYSDMACEKYKISNGILKSFNCGEWGGSSWDNRIDILKDLDFIKIPINLQIGQKLKLILKYW